HFACLSAAATVTLVVDVSAFRSLPMRAIVLTNARPIVILLNSMAMIGALASMFVILVRIPALATTKWEVLSGTLQGTAVALLFVVVALLIDVIYLVHRASRSSLDG